MKPENWNEMDPEEKEAIVLSMMNSMRGRLLITQAFTIASRVMREKVPDRCVEESNCQDLEMCLEVLGLPAVACVGHATQAFLHYTPPIKEADVEAYAAVIMEDGGDAPFAKTA